MSFETDVSRLDSTDSDFLGVLERNVGPLSSRELRKQARLSTNQVHSRGRKLEEMGLVSCKKTRENGREVNQWGLTDLGEDEIDAGLLERYDDVNQNVGSLKSELDDLEERIERMRERHNRNFDILRGQLDGDTDDLEQRIKKVEREHEKELKEIRLISTNTKQKANKIGKFVSETRTELSELRVKTGLDNEAKEYSFKPGYQGEFKSRPADRDTSLNNPYD